MKSPYNLPYNKRVHFMIHSPLALISFSLAYLEQVTYLYPLFALIIFSKLFFFLFALRARFNLSFLLTMVSFTLSFGLGFIVFYHFPIRLFQFTHEPTIFYFSVLIFPTFCAWLNFLLDKYLIMKTFKCSPLAEKIIAPLPPKKLFRGLGFMNLLLSFLANSLFLQ